MQNLHVRLEDWQGAALAELARARGIGVEEMARRLLSERLIERMHTAFDDLLVSPTALVADACFSRGSIEHRLKQLFED